MYCRVDSYAVLRVGEEASVYGQHFYDSGFKEIQFTSWAAKGVSLR